MEITYCEKGHFYDLGKNKTCPICARKRSTNDLEQQSRQEISFVDTANFKTAGIETMVEKIRETAGVVNDKKQIEAYDATQSVNYHGVIQPGSSQARFNPVVGWLVCVKGGAKGMAFQIHNQYNYIGRAKHMNICIPMDPSISEERAAVLAYDDLDRDFYVGKGFGNGYVSVNGKAVMDSVKLQAYDVLTIGETDLLLIPLCCERFDWSNY